MGARQVGKTTLLEIVLGKEKKVLWLSGDEPDVRDLFDGATSTRLKSVIGDNKYVVVDEAQRIKSIGLNLKLITDNLKDVKLIATGSSSFELSSGIGESLAGRKREYMLYPLSFTEIVNEFGQLDEKRLLPHRLVYGSYPEVVLSPGKEAKILKELAGSILYKDILLVDGIRNRDNLDRLLKALAYQIGSQISYNELAQMSGLSQKTAEKYVDVLEKAYIIFRLRSFSRNLRNELKKSRKVYFWDIGIRNAILGDFSLAETRQDIGGLWENYLIAERLKTTECQGSIIRSWFWRTAQQQEIDYVEEHNGQLSAYELKWNPKAKARQPKTFSSAYPDSSFTVINRENYTEFLLRDESA